MQKCTKVAIGYLNLSLVETELLLSYLSDGIFSTIALPSGAAHLISKLLVVHVVAFILTGLLTLECLFVLLITHVDSKFPGASIWVLFLKEKRRELHKAAAENQANNRTDPDMKNARRSLIGHFSWMLLLSALSFLLTLLAFLADIILFIPRLSFLGWIQLLPIALMALIASLLCFMKRSLASRRHLEEEYRGKNDDMRNNGVTPRWVDDSASDDGFYVFTNGFYESGNGHELGRWRTGSLRQNSPDGDLRPAATNRSIDSHDIAELIELQRMN